MTRTSVFVRLSGLALLAWALHMLVRDYIFAFTHGTTSSAEGHAVLGLTSSQYSVLWTAVGPLSLVGLAGVFVLLSPRLGRVGKAGLLVAFLGLAMWFTSSVMQFWILDVDIYFHSPLVYGGWLLSLVSLLVIAIGMVLAGAAVHRADALPPASWLILAIGLLLLPTIALQVYLVSHSDGSLVTRLIYGSLSVPWDLCWAALGYVLLIASRDSERARQG